MAIKSNMDEIDDVTVRQIISEESAKFVKRATAKHLGARIADMSIRVLSKVDSSLESSLELREKFAKNFVEGALPNAKASLKRSVESGTPGTCLVENIAASIHKYVSQESDFRSNGLKNKILLADVRPSRKDGIDMIVKAFESDDVEVELADDMNSEVDDVEDVEIDDIVQASADDVKAAVDDAEEKAEVTRTVIAQFTDVATQADEERNAIQPDPEAAEEGIKFNSTEYIKSIIPTSYTRFALEHEAGNFSKKNLVKMLLTLEDEGNFAEDIDYVAKRVAAIKADVNTVIDPDISKVEDFEKMYSEATSQVDGVFSAFRQVGFGRGDLPAAKRDADTLAVIKGMADITSKDDQKRINDMQILTQSNVVPIESVEGLIKMSIESLELKSMAEAVANSNIDHDSYYNAIELRDEQVGEYLVEGLTHVPAARAERAKDIALGLRKIGNNDGLSQFKPSRLKSIYYKTAQVVAPELLVDYKTEADRVKKYVTETYGTDKYDEIVDDYFNGKQTNSHLSQENLYEVFAFRSAMEISAESAGAIDDEARKKIRAYAGIQASFFATLENLGVVDQKTIQAIVKGKI